MRFDAFAKKEFSALDAESEAGHIGLKRALRAPDLLALGVGAIIGAGIFVLTGSAAAKYAGPAITISFVIAAVACAFAGLCYAEFASLIPIAGSAYTYSYASLGELIAWIIGWDLILEYGFGAAAVAVGWSGYVNSFLQDHGVTIPPHLTAAPGTVLVLYDGRWQRLSSIEETLESAHVALGSIPHVTAAFDLVAFLTVLLVTAILVRGIRESATVNTLIVIVKVSIVLVFVGLALVALTRAGWAPASKNWSPYIPPNAGEFGKYGWSGILRGAAVIFFAYIGFDAVSTAAQEAKNPKRDMPIGILGSLVICTILYILVSGLLTALVPYTALDVPDPVAVGIDATGVGWGRFLVKVGAIFGLASVMLVMLLAQSRVLFTMSNDGLLWPAAAKIHPRFQTPYVSSIVVGAFVAVFAGLVPIGILGELVSIGTLLAFVIVCASVWMLRRRHPEIPRPFKTPWVPFVPFMGMAVALAMMLALPWETWLRLGVWLAIGMAIYFGYGRKHSRVQKALLERPPA
ncbi:Amino acid permease [Labilithrix luteola]|uniref:Amino acid permease n=1 Tax=Labilithrix luteola TaxID=1391654 RepID=A0A0K1PVY9_9BACT|nr:amino acid permease [Labilithrix luteola]AKU97687.1 Amino acid permease [Labilithrix luteola]